MKNRADGYVDQRSRRQPCPRCKKKTLAIIKRSVNHGGFARCENEECQVVVDQHGILDGTGAVITIYETPVAPPEPEICVECGDIEAIEGFEHCTECMENLSGLAHADGTRG